MEALSKIGKLTGRERAAADLVAGMKRRLAAAQPTGLNLELVLRKRPKVLAIVGYNQLIVVGGGTFIDDIMKQAGAENIAGGSRAAYPQYSLETLINERPEYIITTKELMNARGITSDPRWRQLGAVRRNLDAVSADGAGNRLGEVNRRLRVHVSLRWLLAFPMTMRLLMAMRKAPSRTSDGALDGCVGVADGNRYSLRRTAWGTTRH